MWNHSIEVGLPSTHFAARKVTIIPWDQNWLFVLLQELRTWVREGWWDGESVNFKKFRVIYLDVNWSDAKDAFCFWLSWTVDIFSSGILPSENLGEPTLASM